MKSIRLLLTALPVALIMTMGQETRAAVRPASQLSAPRQQSTSVRFAVIGDYGLAGVHEADVASQVKSWQPDFIVTVGDNNYPNGEATTIDANIGQYYHDFIAPYTGAFGAGAATPAFFPVRGNHDWLTQNAQPYLDYFSLPGNERYYDFVGGPVHFFMLDSDPREPDGITASSTQAGWLQAALATSASEWNMVVLHHAPYSSGSVHGSNTVLQWPFRAWGAHAVLAGHEHTYERIMRNGVPYFVDGLGGASIYGFGTPVAGSAARYNSDYGALWVEASSSTIIFQFITRTGIVQDTYQLSMLSVSGNAGGDGVSLSYDDGGPRTAIAETGGAYSYRVPKGWSGTVTPSLTGYVFAPDSRKYTNLTSDQIDQTYVAAPVPQAHPSDATQVCRRPAIGADLVLTDLMLNNGSFDPSTVVLTLDGTDVTASAVIHQTETYPASKASVLYTPTADLVLGDHLASIIYPTTGGPITVSWGFAARNIACGATITSEPAAAEALVSRAPPVEIPSAMSESASAGTTAELTAPTPSAGDSSLLQGAAAPARTAGGPEEDRYYRRVHQPR